MPARLLSSFVLKRRARIVAVVAAALLAVVGGLVLFGWSRDVEGLKRLSGGLVSMKANAAAAFLLGGAALVLRSSDARWARIAGYVPAFVMAAIGGVTLAEYLVGWDAGIDQILFPEAAGAPGTSHPGRMAPNSATSFFLSGVALCLVGSSREWAHQAGEMLAFVGGIVAFQALVGYAFGVEALYAFPGVTQMALHSAAAFFVLMAGILFVAPGRGYMGVLVEPGGAGVAARVLLPIAVILPFLLGLFVVSGIRIGLYDDRVGVSILISLLTLFILAAVGWTTGEIREVDRQRRELLEKEKAARERMEQTLREREELLSVVSHDLRNPLSTVSATASLMLDRIIPLEDQPRHLEIIKRSAHTMERLIQDLLDVTRIERGRLSVLRRRCNVTRILREGCEELGHVGREQGVNLVCRVGDLPAVEADPDRVRQILANLVGNAFRYTAEGGHVTVEAVAEYGDVRVRVTDTGPGIQEGQLGQIFDAFWQGDEGRSQGAGLGLAIVKGLVEAHGGRVWAASPPGEGATFFFTLPIPMEGRGRVTEAEGKEEDAALEEPVREEPAVDEAVDLQDEEAALEGPAREEPAVQKAVDLQDEDAALEEEASPGEAGPPGDPAVGAPDSGPGRSP